MKTVRKFLVYLILVIPLACSNEATDVDNINVRSRLYSEVLKDHNYTMELLDSIRKNHHASMMLYSDTAIMKEFFKRVDVDQALQHLMKRAESDSLSCKKVCMAVMDHKSVMTSMMAEMENKGVMKKGCRMGMSKEPKESKGHH